MIGLLAQMGTPVIVSDARIGAKRAIYKDGKIVVSPAMSRLIQKSEGEELEHLMKNIKLVDMGGSKPAVPMHPRSFFGGA